MTTFKLSANYHSTKMYGTQGGPAYPQDVKLSLEVETLAEATETAARFPKYLRVRAGTLTRDEDGRAIETGLVTWQRDLAANDANGGVNEAGLTHYRKLIAKLDALGYDVTWVTHHTNSYVTREDFERNAGIA